jgi:hypothetical protein
VQRDVTVKCDADCSQRGTAQVKNEWNLTYKVKVKVKMNVKVKVNFTLEQATKVGEYRCSSTLSLTSALDGGGWSTPRPGRFTSEEETRYPHYWRLCGPQGRSGRVREISPSTGIRSPDRTTRSESLYRLSYPGTRNLTYAIAI